MIKDNENKNRLLAALLTLLIGGGIVTTLIVTKLNSASDSNDSDINKITADIIDFGIEDEEFVEFEDMIAEAEGAEELDEQNEQTMQETTSEQITDQAPSQEAGQNELENQGTVNDPPLPPVSSSKESPMKVDKQPEKKIKPQSESKPDATETKKKGENTNTKTNNNTTNTTPPQNKNVAEVANAFNKMNSGNSTAENANGNNGTAGVTNVSGLPGDYQGHFAKAPCPGPGTVVVKVSVSSTGQISNARVIGGTLKNNKRACNICVGLALKSRFGVPKNTTVDREGTITYTVK